MTSVTRSCFTTQHQTCKTKTKTTVYKTKTKTTVYKTKTKTDVFLVSDRSCPKTDGLRPHHCLVWSLCEQMDIPTDKNHIIIF